MVRLGGPVRSRAAASSAAAGARALALWALLLCALCRAAAAEGAPRAPVIVTAGEQQVIQGRYQPAATHEPNDVPTISNTSINGTATQPPPSRYQSPGGPPSQPPAIFPPRFYTSPVAPPASTPSPRPQPPPTTPAALPSPTYSRGDHPEDNQLAGGWSTGDGGSDANSDANAITQEAATDAPDGVGTTDLPPVTTAQPPDTTTEPAATTTEPAATTTKPTATTTKPAATTTKPAATTTDRVEHHTAEHPYGNETAPASEGEAHPCARACVEGAAPMRCYYRFEVAGYFSMSKACYDCPSRAADCARPHCVPGDGTPQSLVVVNRQMPGPAIEVCAGDRVVVDLHNALGSDTTSVHWHGLQQRGTPYADGVPHVTQCPVQPHTAFRYAFEADAAGTHFWHSHSGQQRADGVFGALVVRQPRARDPLAPLYDRDERAHTLLLVDWGAANGQHRFLAHHHAGGTNKPATLLVNGRARVLGAHAGVGARPVPAPEFVVQQGLRYRFRVINAGFLNCPVQLSVDGHDLLVVASDGNDVRPVAAASLVSYAGERWDFVLEANRSVAAYWIRFRGLLDCDERFTAVHQAAVLRYEGAPEAEPPQPLSYDAARRGGHVVNALNVGVGTAGATVVPELEALAEDDESLREEPDLRFYLAYDFYPLDNPHFHAAPHYGFYNVSKPEQQTYTPQLNHISLRLQPSPLMPQRSQLDEGALCNASTMSGQGCDSAYCECTHVLRAPLGAVVEILLIDEGVPYEANHPFHLHGHAFRVVGMHRLGNSTSLEAVQRLDAAGGLRRKLRRAPLKDTCTVPDGGVTVLRLRATNPGYWLFHCHIEFHVEVGMALVLKVGEHADFPPVPAGFPRCGDWLPPVDGGAGPRAAAPLATVLLCVAALLRTALPLS